MIEIIILSFLNYKINNKDNKELKNFQKLVIFLNLIPIFFKIGSITLSFYDVNNRNNFDGNYHYENGNLKIIYVFNPYLVPIGILIFLVLITARSIVNIDLKKYMEKDKIYISKFFLLIAFSIN